MQFALSEEQAQLAEIARDFLGGLPDGRAVAEGADPTDPGVWARIVEEQGWPAMAIPEDLGGFGFGWIELAVAHEAAGARLTPIPLLGSSMATAALLAASPSEARDEALGAIAGGESLTLAWGDTAIDAAHASRAVFFGDGGFFLAPVTEREALPSLDMTRPVYRLAPDASALTPLDADEQRVRSLCEVVLAWESVGAAQACLDMAVEYAKIRHQYGKAIGSFQSIQHLCADLFLAVESARSAAWYAAWAVENHADDARLAARTARAMAGDALFEVAGQNIQIHGGIGFTWEHDAHLYFKRAQATQPLLGTARAHRMAVADALLGAL